MQSTLDEVQKSLEDLRVKELKAVKTSIAVAQEGKTATAQKRDELKAEIEEIRNVVKANLAKLAALQKQKRASDEKATTLERLVGELRALPRGEGSHDRRARGEDAGARRRRRKSCGAP